MCGTVMRRCWLTGGDTGKNAGSHSRLRLWSFQAAPVVTPGRSVHSGAWAASRLRWLNTERASVGAGTPGGTTSHACECSTAPRSSGGRACAATKRGDCRDLPGSVWIHRKTPESAQCPSVRHLGTLGSMSHATQNAPHRTRRAPALTRWAACARTCRAVAKPAQACPTRPVALTVHGGTRDNAPRAVRHDGGPRSWGRAVANGTRSASSLRAPGVRAARLQGSTAFGLSRHGVVRPGDRRAASHLQQSGEFQP
jgi:hypothetical protein